ncbi:uncharacterized protein LOC135717490 [Ochlerotatus camptorhynchus]|uniref:uncharacterized protein LOC135717490 n=1 Tax=Ochlerotatus camptorhynchus TaxID=644619 RepID=UPI0031DB6E9A
MEELSKTLELNVFTTLADYVRGCLRIMGQQSRKGVKKPPNVMPLGVQEELAAPLIRWVGLSGKFTMAPIYDTRDLESDDDSFVLSDLFNENNDSRASGCSDDTLHTCLQPMDPSASKVDCETDSYEATGCSELPPADNSTKVMDTQKGVFSDEHWEIRDASATELERDQASVKSYENGDGDCDMDPNLLHDVIGDFIATISTNLNEQSCTLHDVSEEKMADSGEKRTLSYPLTGDVKKASSYMVVPDKAKGAPKHQANNKAKKVTLESMGKFSNHNGKEYIKAKRPSSVNMPQLGFSARLTYEQLNIVIHNQGSLMVTDDNFVAIVKLNRPHLLIDTRNFRHATEVLLDELRVDRVLLDEVTTDRDKHRELFLTSLENVIKQLAADEGQVNTRIELLKLVEKSKQCRSLTYFDLCREVMNNRFKNETLQRYTQILDSIERTASRRERLFRRFRHVPKDNSPNLFVRLDALVMEIAELHRNKLITKAPAYLHKPLGTISLKHLMLISSSDVKLFTDMTSALKPEIFDKPLQDLANRWINRVKSIKDNRLDKPLQLTSVSLFFICKSLEEVIIEITERTDQRETDLLTSSNLGWHPIKLLVWKTENAFTKCLQREYHFIFRLLKHFEVASDFGLHPFPYETQLFNNGQSSSRGVLSGVKDALVRTGRFFGYSSYKPNPFGVPDDFYVWYCLLDDVLFHVLPNGCELDSFDNVFEEYVQMIRDAKYDQMETLRVVTHNLIRFIAQSCSYHNRTSLDKAVLRKQLNIFSFKTNQTVVSSNNFRDQVDVFNRFWNTRSDIIDQFSTKINLPEINLLQERLMEIMQIGLDKNVEVDTMVAFCRTYNDFLIDLNEVSFEWYIKDIPEFDMQSVIHLGKVELVDNKWKDTNNRTYRVLNPEKFPTLCKGLGITVAVPKHYVIEVIQALLEHIGSQLQRNSWATDENLSDTDQILSTNELIFAIRNSLLYLKEQIDYVSFDLFYDERVKPFISVLETTTSRQDFSNRIYLIKESFWYIRKQNEISFEDALQLYDELNSTHDLQLLRESYAMYSKFFEEFMQLSVDEEHSERAALIAEKVKDQHSDTTHFKAWDDRFKQDQVPKMLAGLAAVWSILVSKDVAKAGKYFNPHCIQILCILRLLSADKADEGIDKHLAQVLTGQGKSLVLGLLAALFALTGHRVRIACYSKYLAKRDEQDFLTFFETFDVAEDVTYGTFDELANEIIAPKVDGQTIELRGLVRDLLFKEKAILPHQLVMADSSKNILLLDEVDVFFTKEFYGNTYNPGCTPLIPGLDLIQEQIWKYVVAGWTDVESRIRQYIQSGEFKEQGGRFFEFLERPNNYSLIKTDGTQITYTNKTLFDNHVRMMIDDAVNVNNGWSCAEFKLNSAGVITYYDRGMYVSHTICGYLNVFNYFRLKKTNFVTKVNGTKNYGYLKICCGSLSYAMLPKNYPLIIGVSGTLTSLNRYEKDTIERLYNIKQISVMPTFFGCSNLQFDEIVNFHHHATKPSWRTNIFSQANQIIAVNRAVIIFFDTDVELNAFETEYAGQLDRVNVLTENTEDKERFINEAGVAKTITLATRGMGRGVDYKSSVTVEKNGGLHVVQTFFSMDIKEETQIKGRTARKDNKGSYELIVCDEDLQSVGLMSDLSNVSYAELDAARSKISLDENAELSRKIQDGMVVHRNTMNYMSTFYKKA